MRMRLRGPIIVFFVLLFVSAILTHTTTKAEVHEFGAPKIRSGPTTRALAWLHLSTEDQLPAWRHGAGSEWFVYSSHFTHKVSHFMWQNEIFQEFAFDRNVLKHSTNFESAKNVRSSNVVEFEFELRHIPTLCTLRREHVLTVWTCDVFLSGIWSTFHYDVSVRYALLLQRVSEWTRVSIETFYSQHVFTRSTTRVFVWNRIRLTATCPEFEAPHTFHVSR